MYIYFPFSCPFICVEEAEPEESEEPFVAPAGLSIPPDVELVSVRYSASFLETLTFSVFLGGSLNEFSSFFSFPHSHFLTDQKTIFKILLSQYLINKNTVHT